MTALNPWEKQRSRLAFAVAMALALSQAACGGGSGGGVRPEPPPPTPPPEPSRPEPAFDAHLDLTNTYPAHDAGLTGAGSIIGVIDTGVNRNHPALAGRVIENLVYVGAPNDLSVDDVAGHGTAVAQIIAGKPVGEWPGGIAPGAQIVSARIINDENPPDDGTGQGNEVPPGDSTPTELGNINSDLIGAGVRITNNSWGGLYWASDAVTAGFVQAYTPFVIQHGGLVVFATGNEGNPQPSDTASLPSQGGGAGAAALEKGWLAVGWLDNATPTQLDPDSNACGIAMNYCLVAPGGVITTGTDDAAGNPTYWQWFGTSLATPQVSGAAALVWEAFPYFDNNLVRQTLLGGATDLGATGVDAVFGYGLLNVGKSVRGPSKFNWGNVEATFDGIASTWSNDISGSGGLIKRGTGMIELSGDNTYTGTTEVFDGTLSITGSNAGSSFQIGPQGNLTGTGSVAKNVSNNGRLSLQGLSALTIGGNYSQTPSATLALEIGHHLQVNGTAALDGDLHVLGLKDGYVWQAKEVVVNADGGLSGTFDTLSMATGVLLVATPGYDANQAWLDITSLDVTAVQGLNYTAASTGSAARVESAMNAIDRQIAGGGSGAIGGDFIAAAGAFQRAPTMQAAEASLQSLSGELHATADAMTYEGIDASRRALSARFDDLGERPLLGGMWQRSLSQSGGMARAGFSGFDYDINGQMYGMDQRFGQHGVFGFATSRTQGAGWLDQGNDRSRSRQDEGQVYAGLIGDNAYLHGRIGFGRFDRQVDRRILLGTRETGAATSYSGTYDVAQAETGWRMRLGPSLLTPYLASQFARIRNDGFSESGADGFGLKANANSSERWQAIAGLRANRDWRLAGGRWLGLEARAEWQKTLSASGSVFDASFVGVEQWQSLAGIGLADQSRLFSIGMNLGLSDRATLNFDLSHRYAPNLEDNQVSMQYALGF